MSDPDFHPVIADFAITAFAALKHGGCGVWPGLS